MFRIVFFIIFGILNLYSGACHCVETNSQTEATKYINSIVTTLNNDIETVNTKLSNSIDKYNLLLKQNIHIQDEWTVALIGELLNQKKKNFLLKKKKSLKCLYSDIQILSINHKILLLKLLLAKIKAKFAQQNSVSIAQNISASQR